MPKRYMVSGGGTGGHIFPAIAIAQALQAADPDASFLFIGALGRMEMDRVPAAGFPITGLPIQGIDRKKPWRNLSLPLNLWKSYRLAAKELERIKPHAVVGVGGYASAALGLAAAKAGIPLILQEQNAFPGKTNRWLGKKASAVCVAHPGLESYFPGQKIHLTGNPVRPDFEKPGPAKEEAKSRLGFLPDKPLLFLTGGSLGSGALNRSLFETLPHLLQNNIQVCWQTGSREFNHWKNQIAPQDGLKIVDFQPEMALTFHAADLVVSRAGAIALAELAMTACPSILVPLPSAADDHQTFNARSVSERGGAVMLPENQLFERLWPTIWQLLGTPDSLQNMKKSLLEIRMPGAATRIAQIIQSCQL